MHEEDLFWVNCNILLVFFCFYRMDHTQRHGLLRNVKDFRLARGWVDGDTRPLAFLSTIKGLVPITIKISVRQKVIKFSNSFGRLLKCRHEHI